MVWGVGRTHLLYRDVFVRWREKNRGALNNQFSEEGRFDKLLIIFL